MGRKSRPSVHAPGRSNPASNPARSNPAGSNPARPDLEGSLRQATREAREATKDLNRALAGVKAERQKFEEVLRVADAMLARLLPEATRNEFNRVLKAEVEASEVRLAESLAGTINSCQAAIMKKFQTLADQYFGTKDRVIPTFEEVLAAQKVVRWADELRSSGVTITDVMDFHLPKFARTEREGNDDDQQPPSAFHRG